MTKTRILEKKNAHKQRAYNSRDRGKLETRLKLKYLNLVNSEYGVGEKKHLCSAC